MARCKMLRDQDLDDILRAIGFQNSEFLYPVHVETEAKIFGSWIFFSFFFFFCHLNILIKDSILNIS